MHHNMSGAVVLENTNPVLVIRKSPHMSVCLRCLHLRGKIEAGEENAPYVVPNLILILVHTWYLILQREQATTYENGHIIVLNSTSTQGGDMRTFCGRTSLV